jgi:hypothetical protein
LAGAHRAHQPFASPLLAAPFLCIASSRERRHRTAPRAAAAGRLNCSNYAETFPLTFEVTGRWSAKRAGTEKRSFSAVKLTETLGVVLT